MRRGSACIGGGYRPGEVESVYFLDHIGKESSYLPGGKRPIILAWGFGGKGGNALYFLPRKGGSFLPERKARTSLRREHG